MSLPGKLAHPIKAFMKAMHQSGCAGLCWSKQALHFWLPRLASDSQCTFTGAWLGSVPTILVARSRLRLLWNVLAFMAEGKTGTGCARNTHMPSLLLHLTKQDLWAPQAVVELGDEEAGHLAIVERREAECWGFFDGGESIHRGGQLKRNGSGLTWWVHLE